MVVPLLDLKAQYEQIKSEVRAAIEDVFERQQFILGRDVAALEQAIADYSTTQHAVGCASGSDALLLALMALGIGRDDEVITTPFTFFATGGSIARLGARPIYVDIDPETFNIHPSALEQAITSRTRAIIPVHLFGQMAEMDEIMDIANRYGLYVIEDAAQAIGAEYKSRRAGSIGHIGCLSFFPTKNLGGAGDGGMVLTNDEQLAEKIRTLRVHGGRIEYVYKMIGCNSRLDELQAAILRVKLKYLDDWTERRRVNAAIYDRLFLEYGLSEHVKTPVRRDYCRHIFHQYTVRVTRREDLINWLKEHKIGCKIYYPLPLHLQECFAYLGYKPGDLPVAEQAAREVLSLPIYPELTEEQIHFVVRTIAKFYDHR
ncbi:MAG: DegT/DnrJ/EryC1/StrS family aminotransferase [Acidobacteriota bacterium]|nr:DegT/DnrJ/EryC1/StrS family aminotransferase [Blastocatellia bacterium]MDW8413610.1 DegT/DnrJ/EryC1/StrS family aminotransferase [Acidobacteriota bacterium]